MSETAVSTQSKEETEHLAKMLRDLADLVERRGIHSLRGGVSYGTMDITDMIQPEPAYVCECYDGNVHIKYMFRYADWQEFVNEKIKEFGNG